MSRTLEGRTAIVTGASRGIGRATALAMADEGADVVLVARSAPALAEVFDAVTRRGRRAVAVTRDVTADDAADHIVQRALSEFGRVDILVNNAGGNSFTTPLASMRMSGWQKTVTLNLDSTVRMIQASLPAITQGGHGSIINVSSVTGMKGVPGMSHYAAAKAAVISLTRSLALEVAADGVRVNALVPGWIETDLTGFLREDGSVEQSLLADVPMARWGTADEIARGAVFLASDESSFMTGQSLVLDGGLTAR